MGLSHHARAGLSTALAVVLVALTSSDAVADQVRTAEWWLNTLQVPHAWMSTRGSGVTVAVLDTGVSPVQPDLTGSVVSGPDFTGSGRIRGGRYWGRHGTQVASLIAGHGHGPGRSEGMIGVAPEARILSVRVTLESNDPRLAEPAVARRLPVAIARGIDYAVSHGASVIDLPLDPVTRHGVPGAGGSRAEQEAIEHALARNVVLVAPAGDAGTHPGAVDYPAAYPGVVSVGAFGPGFTKASFSSHGRVTLTAPGEDVVTALPHHGYARVASTSAASAIAAGVVALIRAQFATLTPSQITKVLTASAAHRSPGVMNIGSGTSPINAASALAAASHLAAATGSKPLARGHAGLAPPTPARSAASNGLGHTPLMDILVGLGALGALFCMLIGFRALRRRRARTARFAEIRAAAQLPRTRRALPPPRAAHGPQSSAASLTAGTVAGSGLGGAPIPGFLGAPPAAATAMPPAPAGLATATPFTGSAPPWAVQTSEPLPGTPGAHTLTAPRNPWQPVPLPPGALPGGPLASTFAGTRGPAAPPQQPGPFQDSHTWAPSTAPVPDEEESGPAGHGPQPSWGPGDQPTVSGRPPWDTAPQPDGELPWTRGPGQPYAESPELPPRAAGPQSPARDAVAVAGQAWPGGPPATDPYAPASNPAGSGPAHSDPAHSDPAHSDPAHGGPGRSGDSVRAAAGGQDGPGRAAQDRPIYVWNPVTGPASARPSTSAPRSPHPQGRTPGGAPAPRATPPWETLDAPRTSSPLQGPQPSDASSEAAGRDRGRAAATAAGEAGPLPVRKPSSPSWKTGQPSGGAASGNLWERQARSPGRTGADPLTPGLARVNPFSGEPLGGAAGRAPGSWPGAATPEPPGETTETFPAVPGSGD